jgi:soluble lytic murein transglycosylase-like protein
LVCKIDLRDLITQEAQRQGVDPALALSVAQTESGTCQWTPSGAVVVSSAGAIGVFQLEPATAAQLGVDPNDVNDNIRGGITYLKQLYQKYGSWSQALAAYNWGPTKVSSAIASGSAWPVGVWNYVTAILGRTIGTNAAAAAQAASTSSPISTADILGNVLPPASNTPVIAVISLLGLGAIVWWLTD